jgi:hypothetical protein
MVKARKNSKTTIIRCRYSWYYSDLYDDGRHWSNYTCSFVDTRKSGSSQGNKLKFICKGPVPKNWKCIVKDKVKNKVKGNYGPPEDATFHCRINNISVEERSHKDEDLYESDADDDKTISSAPVMFDPCSIFYNE